MVVAIDTETTGLNPWHGDRPFAVVLFWQDGTYEYYEWDVDPYTRDVHMVPADVERIKTVCADESVRKVFHNAKFDIQMLEQSMGAEIRGPIDDTMFMAFVANTDEIQYRLKYLTMKYLSMDGADEKDLKQDTIAARRHGKKEGWLLGDYYRHTADGTLVWKSDVEADYWMPRAIDPTSSVCERYCVLDGERTMALYEMYSRVLPLEEQQEIYEREMALWPTVYAMENRGVRVLWENLRSEIRRLKNELIDWKKKLNEFAGKEINTNSTKQIAEMLRKNDVDILQRTATGEYKTGMDVLADYVTHPCVEALMHYRTRSTVLSSFLWRFYDLAIRDEDGSIYLHPDLNQVGARTARFSCRNPNMQNIRNQQSARSYVPIEPRSVIGPREDYVWYSIDYSQLEGSLFADISQESGMLEALANGRDLMTDTTLRVWYPENPKTIERLSRTISMWSNTEEGSSIASDQWLKQGYTQKDIRSMSKSQIEQIATDWYEQCEQNIVTAEELVARRSISRNNIKQVFFLKIFGGGVRTLVATLNSTWEEAERIMKDFDTAFPEVNDFIRATSDRAYREGYVMNRFGRKIRVDRMFSYRAVNYAVQSAAADLLKSAMLRTAKWLHGNGIDGHLVLSIHDEIVFEIRRRYARKSVVRNLTRIMEDHEGVFSIPLKTKVALIERQWNEKREITV